jgi:hypothetical protein
VRRHDLGQADRVVEVDEALCGSLRLEVHRLRQQERRRVFPPVLHVGPLDDPVAVGLGREPLGDLLAAPTVRSLDPTTAVRRAGARTHLVDLAAVDDALRTDVVARALEQASDRGCGAWLTRVGDPWPHDLDRAWLGSARRAFVESGRAPAFLVAVTKTGWYEPFGTGRRTWRRLRIRTRGPAPGGG